MDVPGTAAAAPEPSGSPLATNAGRVGLRGRLLAALLVVAVIAAGIGFFGISRMAGLRDQTRQVFTAGAEQLDALRTLQATWSSTSLIRPTGRMTDRTTSRARATETSSPTTIRLSVTARAEV